jgi:hypothetical protein
VGVCENLAPCNLSYAKNKNGISRTGGATEWEHREPGAVCYLRLLIWILIPKKPRDLGENRRIRGVR